MADTKISALSDGGAILATDEFVVARSGADNKITGSGIASASILAVTHYEPASIATYNVTNTTGLTALDTTNLTVSFTVPASGNVLVTANLSAQSPTGSGGIGLGLLNHSGGAQIGSTQDQVVTALASVAGLIQVVSVTWYLTSLSAGTLGLDLAAGVNGGTGHIYAMGHTGAANGSKVGPALIIVQSA